MLSMSIMGLGNILGIETLVINGVHKDYLHIRYHGTDKLYVPVEQIDLSPKICWFRRKRAEDL